MQVFHVGNTGSNPARDAILVIISVFNMLPSDSNRVLTPILTSK
jgi:hypothetical protein